MTHEGRMARGKENFERNRFLNNSETLEYLATKANKPEKPKEEKKDVKSNK